MEFVFILELDCNILEGILSLLVESTIFRDDNLKKAVLK